MLLFHLECFSESFLVLEISAAETVAFIMMVLDCTCCAQITNKILSLKKGKTQKFCLFPEIVTQLLKIIRKTLWALSCRELFFFSQTMQNTAKMKDISTSDCERDVNTAPLGSKKKKRSWRCNKASLLSNRVMISGKKRRFVAPQVPRDNCNLVQLWLRTSSAHISQMWQPFPKAI